MPPTKQTIDPWRKMARLLPTQARFIRSGSKYRLYSSGYGGGKLLALSTPIPTPSGWTTMGEIKVGDRVFDERGRPCYVTAICDEVPKRAWRMRFSDSTEIVAGGDHQWATWDYAARKEFNRRHPRTPPGDDWPTWESPRARRGPKIRITDEIAGTLKLDIPGSASIQNNHAIPVAGMLQIPDQPLPMDPYVLGAWLGDGTTRDISYTCHDDDAMHFKAEFERAGYRVVERPGSRVDHKSSYAAHGLRRDLRAAGVFDNKRVPEQYLWAGVEQRIALLQGLMDTDGHADGHNRNRVEFCAMREGLALAVLHLARSLGQKPVLKTGRAMLNGVDHGTKYRVTWRPTIQVFRLPRKLERIKLDDAQITRSYWRMIVGCDEIPPEPMKCIEVDSPHSLYLAGEAMIPTHNSKLGCRESIRHALVYGGSRHMVGRYVYKDLIETTMVTFFRECREIGLNDGTGPGPRHYSYSKSEMKVHWWNGAETLFTNLDDPTGSKFGSLEISTAFIDEGSEVPRGVYEVLFPGRLRWHLPGCDLAEDINEWMDRNPGLGAPRHIRCACMDIWRGWVCTNPGPSDYLLDVVGEVDEEGGCPPAGSSYDGWEVFYASPRENPYNGPDYYDELEKLGKAYGDHWFKRFMLGRWDSFEGQRFPMLDKATHMLPDQFSFHPAAWDFYSGWDFGWNAPTAQVLLAVNRNGEYPPCVVDEYEANKSEVPVHAEAIRLQWQSYELDEDPQCYGDPAGEQAHSTSGTSTIQKYEDEGIYITPAKWAKSPINRADQLGIAFTREVETPDGPMRGLMIHPRADRLWRALVQYRYEEQRQRNRDEKETFVKKNDHLVDALGYGFASTFPAEPEDHKAEAKASWREMVESRRVPTPDEMDRIEAGQRPR